MSKFWLTPSVMPTDIDFEPLLYVASDAYTLIRFSIKGDAKIIGVGNGDPSSHEPDKCAGAILAVCL